MRMLVKEEFLPQKNGERFLKRSNNERLNLGFRALHLTVFTRKYQQIFPTLLLVMYQSSVKNYASTMTYINSDKKHLPKNFSVQKSPLKLKNHPTSNPAKICQPLILQIYANL